MEKRALEPSTVCRRSVRRKHDLDRQREQRPQSLDDLLAGDQPLVQREPAPKPPGESPATSARHCRESAQQLAHAR